MRADPHGHDQVIDSHVHFWDPSALAYPWLDALPQLRRPFGPAEYRAASGGVPVGSVLFVEANAAPHQSLAEVERVTTLARDFPWIAGIVAFLDLAAGSAEAALDRLAPHPLVRGVRQNIQGQRPGFCLQPDYLAGVRATGARGLVVDLCATHDQIPDLIALVDGAPETVFVLDHCAKPAIRSGSLDPWRADLARLAERPNLRCKLSGLLTEMGPADTLERILPFAEHVVEAFGPDRLLYGSDWPVLTLAGNHPGWYDFTRTLTRGWSADETRGFYHENSARVYGLAPVAPPPDRPIRRD